MVFALSYKEGGSVSTLIKNFEGHFNQLNIATKGVTSKYQCDVYTHQFIYSQM